MMEMRQASWESFGLSFITLTTGSLPVSTRPMNLSYSMLTNENAAPIIDAFLDASYSP